MTNEEAVETIESFICMGCGFDNNLNCGISSCDVRDAVEKVEEALEEQEHYGWHDLERDPKDLPKKEGQYMIFTKDGRFGRWYWSEDRDWSEVLMWQQLPEEIERRLT